MFGEEGPTLAISISIGIAVFVAVMAVLALLCGLFALIPEMGLLEGGDHEGALNLARSLLVG